VIYGYLSQADISSVTWRPTEMSAATMEKLKEIAARHVRCRVSGKVNPESYYGPIFISMSVTPWMLWAFAVLRTVPYI
jgi:hypothetical protein